MRIQIELLNLAPDRAPNLILGPFDWVTFTFDVLRAGMKDEDGDDLVFFRGAVWNHEGEEYSDINLDPVE